ncbi:DUF6397 family protein [Streptomyces sp. NPDC046831]|uniref:DUF6397 family protein n=1 Tax=Streptomyces sp. NPDC046831 TaxID=3154805 RepID=UPI003401771C
MAGNSITRQTAFAAEQPAPAAPRAAPLTLGRAARELRLERNAFHLAVLLGLVATALDGGGNRRVDLAEVERLRGEPGFPASLLERVETVGTKEGAALLEVTTARFTRLARLGAVVPIAFRLNRYRAVVWRYLADDLRQFAADAQRAPLLGEPLPEGLRDQLDAGLDLRPRNWRGRRTDLLLRQADDPWERAAVVAALLGQAQVAELVQDPDERAHLHRFRPLPCPQGAPRTPAARLTAHIMTAADPDEIELLRSDLERALAKARAHRPAPPRRRAPLAAPRDRTTQPAGSRGRRAGTRSPRRTRSGRGARPRHGAGPFRPNVVEPSERPEVPASARSTYRAYRCCRPSSTPRESTAPRCASRPVAVPAYWDGPVFMKEPDVAALLEAQADHGRPLGQLPLT